MNPVWWTVPALTTGLLLAGCDEDGSDGAGGDEAADTGGRPSGSGGGGPATSGGEPGTGGEPATGGADPGTGGRAPTAGALPIHEGDGPPAGNPDGDCEVPPEAAAVDTSSPDRVIGDGTPESCTSAAVVDAIAQGGIITFDCGPDPLTITREQTAKIFNDTGPDIVIDGGGLITLSGGGERRILYMNTCDEAQVWLTDHCQDQDQPRLTLQNLTFIDGNSSSETEYDGGGAVWVRGGRLKVVNSRFFNNVCAAEGPDVGGAGIRAFSQYQGLPIYVVGSTFGGAEGYGNECANGGGISSIGVSWTVINSVSWRGRCQGQTCASPTHARHRAVGFQSRVDVFGCVDSLHA